MKINPSEIIDIINEVENEFPVDRWVINKVHIWPLIRMQIKDELFRYHLDPERSKNDIKRLSFIASQGINAFKDIRRYIYAYFSDYKNNTDINSSADIVFLTYTVHRTLLNRVWYDRYCEPYIDIFQRMSMRTLTLEMSANKEYRLPRYKPSVFIQHRIYYLMGKNLLFKRRVDARDEELEGFSGFMNSTILSKFAINVPDIRKLRYSVNVIVDLADYFKRIFMGKTFIAFVAEYYNHIGFAFNLACREAGIPSVDIQHGTTGEYHNAYGRWNKVPEGGYELLPSVFWCWSAEEANAILGWNKAASDFHKPFIGGDLWLNLWKTDTNSMVRYYDEQIEQMKSRYNKPVFILYTFDKFYGFPEWVLDGIKLSADSSCWWIRIHPTQWDERERVRDLLRSYKITNFELDSATEFPLPALLRHTDVHITATSSSVREAESFDVPSVITHNDGAYYHSKQIASGIAVQVFTTEDLLKGIEDHVRKKRQAQQRQSASFHDNQEIINNFLTMFKQV